MHMQWSSGMIPWELRTCNGSCALWSLAVKIVSTAAGVFVPECGVFAASIHLVVHFSKWVTVCKLMLKQVCCDFHVASMTAKPVLCLHASVPGGFMSCCGTLTSMSIQGEEDCSKAASHRWWWCHLAETAMVSVVPKPLTIPGEKETCIQTFWW